MPNQSTYRHKYSNLNRVWYLSLWTLLSCIKKELKFSLLTWCSVFVFRFPVVAMGVLKWVDWTVSEPRYFQLQTDHTPVHLALLDEVQNYCYCENFNIHSLRQQLNSNLVPTDLYVPPAAAPAGPPAAHQALWDGALSAGRHGAGQSMLLSCFLFQCVVSVGPLSWQFYLPLRWSWRRLCWTEWFICWVVATSCLWSGTFASVSRNSTRTSRSLDILSRR